MFHFNPLLINLGSGHFQALIEKSMQAVKKKSFAS